MKKKIILPLIAGLGIITFSAFTVANSSGIQWWSGSPWDGGTANGTCSACHSGGSSTPTIAITTNPAFGGTGTQKTYVAGTTYTITVTPSGSYAAYGFNMEIINSTSSVTATDKGTFGTAVSSNCSILPSSGQPTTASHNTPSTSPFSFKWTAPASGTAYLYAVGLGVNMSGNEQGDKVSAVTSYTLTQNTSGIASHESNAPGMQIMPNPATDNVRINYYLENRGEVSLKLYNLGGEFVAELFKAMQDKGPQSVESHLPVGIAKGAYLVRLSVNGKESMQKLMVN